MAFLASQPEACVHGLQGRHTVLLRHNAAGADLTGGDQPDVDAGIRQGTEHPTGGAGGGRHSRAHSADPGDGLPFFQCGAGPLRQQGSQGDIRPVAILLAQDETDVAGTVAVESLRLNDGIEADAPFRQGGAQGCRGAGSVRHMAHRELGLITVEGDSAHFGLVRAAQLRIQLHLCVRHIEGLLDGLQRLAAGGGIDHAAHLHFAGGDQPQVDPLLRKAIEQVGGDAGTPHDPGTTDAEFGQSPLGRQLSAQAVEHRLAHRAGTVQLGFCHREGDVVAAALVGGLDDQIHVDARRREGLEQACGDAGLIRDVGEGQHGLSFHLLHTIHGAAQFQAVLADRSFAAAGEQRSGLVTPTRTHPHGNAVVAGNLHRPRVQHRGPQAGQFQHLVAAHLRHQLRIGHLARVGAEHAGDIGVDLTDVSLERRREGHGRGVGSAPTEGGDFRHAAGAAAGALEAGHHHDPSFVEVVLDAIGADFQDAGAAVGGFGHDPHLRPGHRNSRHPLLIQGHRQQGDRHLFAAGQQHVHLPLWRVVADRCGQTGQLIGGMSHGRHHHHHGITGVAAAPDPLGHSLDAFDAADGGAAELLHQEGHGRISATLDFLTQPSSPSRKASPGWAPRLSRASTSSRRPSRERNRFGGRPCNCLRIT